MHQAAEPSINHIDAEFYPHVTTNVQGCADSASTRYRDNARERTPPVAANAVNGAVDLPGTYSNHDHPTRTIRWYSVHAS